MLLITLNQIARSKLKQKAIDFINRKLVENGTEPLEPETQTTRVLNIDYFTNQKNQCQHCGNNMIKYGLYKGQQRFRCKTCNKTVINLHTGVKDEKKWKLFLRRTFKGYSISKTSKELNIHPRTVIAWRVKLYKSFRIHRIYKLLDVDKINYQGESIRIKYIEADPFSCLTWQEQLERKWGI